MFKTLRYKEADGSNEYERVSIVNDGKVEDFYIPRQEIIDFNNKYFKEAYKKVKAYSKSVCVVPVREKSELARITRQWVLDEKRNKTRIKQVK